MGGKNDDFSLDTMFENDSDVETIFDDKKSTSLLSELDSEFSDDFSGKTGVIGGDIPDTLVSDIPDISEPAAVALEKEEPVYNAPAPAAGRRSAKDFKADMDALLLTAQSSMIIDGLKCYSQKKFSADTYHIYQEALKGVGLYITILNRNPDNYHKLKALIDSDIDCQEVEKTAFNLFKKVNKDLPETDSKKVQAFEMMQKLFHEAVSRSSISNSMSILKQYQLFSGNVNESKILSCIQTEDLEFKTFINNLNQQIKMACEMLKRGNVEISKGLKGKDINIFVIKASELLTYYYHATRNESLHRYYSQMHTNYKKYQIVR